MSASIIDHDPSEVLLKQKELALLRAKLSLIKSNGIAFYRPHEKQHEFHSSSAKRRGLFAGNRFGKSESAAAETAAWFVGERTWYKYSFPIYGMREGLRVVVSFHDGHENHPLVRQGIPRGATKQLVITTDWKKVDIVWTSILGDDPGKIWKFLPHVDPIETKKNHEGTIDQIWDSKSGSIIRFTTEQAFMKNPQSVESTDNDRISIDEPIINEMWIGASRGLIDRDGQGDFTLTSLRQRWIYDYFNPEEAPQESRFCVKATTYDNPYNSPEAISRFEAELTPEERECRLMGLPLELTGLVYKEFSQSKHILTRLPLGWVDWNSPPLNYTIYVSIDVHDKFQVALFTAVPPVGAPIIYNEIFQNFTADDLAIEIKNRTVGRYVGFMKADPRAWEEDPVYRVSMASRFFAHGLPVEKASKAKRFGIQNMRNILKQTPNQVWFAPRSVLPRTLREIANYAFVDDEPMDKDDHCMECMYRTFIAPLTWLDSKVTPLPDFTEIPSSRGSMSEFNRANEMAYLNN